MRHASTRRRVPFAATAAFAATAGFVCLAAGLWAQESKPSEYRVKAIYLYHFTQFVQWPGDSDAADGPFSICVLGEDPFRAFLDDAVAGESVYGRGIVVERVPAPQDALGCRILYISTSEAGHLDRIFAALNKANVLTVSDMPYFTQRGGMIQFTQDANRVRFAVNLSSAQEAGLMLSSELLRLAVSVRRASQPGR